MAAVPKQPSRDQNLFYVYSVTHSRALKPFECVRWTVFTEPVHPPRALNLYHVAAAICFDNPIQIHAMCMCVPTGWGI